MIERRLKQHISNALERSPSVAMIGPRQVGKTTLALEVGAERKAVYLDLENPVDQEKAKDILAFQAANRGKLIILDEVQRLPEIFGTLRGIIDKERRQGCDEGLFLFLGSASLDLLQQSSESLAGRFAYSELYSLDALEIGGHDPEKLHALWCRGGFPKSFLATSDTKSLAWRSDFIRTYLERDIPQFGPRLPAERLRRFWTMLAHHQGTVLNGEQMARNLELGRTTVGRYLDLLVDLLLVRRLKPWTFNIGKRLVKSPKIYVRDSGLVHALLNIGSFNDLLGHPVIGGSWEGFVIENLMAVGGSRVQPYFFRTAGGAEIDLVLEMPGGEKWAVEIKRSSVPSVKKGFHVGCDDVKPTQKFIVYEGTDRFPMEGGIQAISLYELMDELRSAVNCEN